MEYYCGGYSIKNKPLSNALVVPESDRPILLFFVSGNEIRVLSEWKEEEVQADLERFLSKCVQEEVRIKSIKMTKWHKDEYCQGSYTFGRVGQDQ